MTKNISTKKLGFTSVFLLGLNGIIGSGIFILPGTIYQALGNWSIGFIFLAGAASLLLALCYADLSSRIDGNGGAWLYTYETFGKFAGFQIGWFSLVQGIVTISAEVVALVNVIKLIVPEINQTWTSRFLAIGIIILITILNLAGPKISKMTDNVSSIAKIFALVFFVGVGTFFLIKTHNFSLTSYSMKTTDANSSFSTIFYMFTGFAFLPIAAKSMENAKKNLPKALVSVILIVSAIYAVVQAVVIMILGSSVIGQDAPLALAMSKIVGEVGRYIIYAGMIISIFGVAFSVAFSTPYVAESLVNEHKLLPEFLGKKTSSGSPITAILLTTIASSLLVLSGSYLFLVSCVVLISLVQYIMVALSAIKQDKIPDPNSFHLKFGNTIPILALLLCFYLLFGIKMNVWIFCLILFAAGCVLFITDKRQNRPAK